MLRRLIVGGFAVGLLASALFAKPGVVTNKQGETFKGDVTEDEKFVYIDSTGGQLKLDKRNIARIDYEQSVDDQYNFRHSKLAATDVKGRIELANWANGNQRADLAVASLTEARQIDPTNRDAAMALDAAQRQMDLDQAAKGNSPIAPGSPAATAPAANVSPASQSTAAPVAVKPNKVPLLHRLLTADEINIIRQKEMSSDDPRIKVRFENGVVRRYLAAGDHDAAAFAALSPVAQAVEILANGDAKMIKDVRILTDPTPLLEYKQKVQPIVALGCGSYACHGGKNAGNFSLYSGDSQAATYTNFYTFQTYSKTVDGVKYLAMDREVPDNSLALQFGLPASVGKPAHPPAPGWRPRFKTTNDQAYADVYDWLSKSLRLPQPEYGIKVSASVPATQPADDAAAK